jgi:hypothetical protein
MPVAVPFGHERLALDIPPGRLIEVRRPPAPAGPVADPAAAVRFALEHPHNFPPLRRALTADDRVTVVVDEELPGLAGLLTPVLEHLTSAGVSPEAVTLVCPPSSGGQAWLDDLPDAFEEVHVEVHQPQDRTRLCYLDATGHGRRLYLNRSLVEADQFVVLSGRGYDPLSGYSGAEALLYPQFGDEAARKNAFRHLSLENLGQTTALLDEAVEVAWLLGSPFLLQVLVGEGGTVTQVLGGLMSTSAEGRRLLDETWRAGADRLADVVVAVVPGEAGPHDFAVVARALGNVARAVRPRGRVILLTRRRPEPGPSGQLLSRTDSPARALDLLRREAPSDAVAAYLWVSAAQRASVHLLSGLSDEAASKLFTTPIHSVDQIQGLIPADSSCLILTDSDRTVVDAVATDGQSPKGSG